METTYSYEKKKRLAERISKLKRKEDMVKIFEIIYQDNKNITENQNGLFMFFHTLNDSTYHKIDLFLRSSVNKKTPTNTASESEKKEYSSYAKNEFPDQEKLNPKLKYSNREKNLIKRQRYDEHLTSEHNSDNGIIYQKFDVNDSDNSDKKSTSPTITKENITDSFTIRDGQQNCLFIKETEQFGKKKINKKQSVK